MSDVLAESFRATCFLCRGFFKTWADFACVMCSAFSAVRPHCMLNDTSFRKLADLPVNTRDVNLVKAERNDILTVPGDTQFLSP